MWTLLEDTPLDITSKFDIAMFGRKINRKRSAQKKTSKEAVPDCGIRRFRHVYPTHVRKEEPRRSFASVCVHVHPRQDGSKSVAGNWLTLDPPMYYSVRGRYIPARGRTRGKGSRTYTEAAEEPHERVDRGFRHPISKQRDVNLQRKKGDSPWERKGGRERKSFSIAPV